MYYIFTIFIRIQLVGIVNLWTVVTLTLSGETHHHHHHHDDDDDNDENYIYKFFDDQGIRHGRSLRLFHIHRQ